MLESQLILGRYFTYCQWCIHDGSCVLRHNEFLGQPSNEKIDRSPYPGHEDLRWHLSAFQRSSHRANCNGRIHASGSIFVPLVCECGTALSSLTFSSLLNTGMCKKFSPNRKGKRRKRIAAEILARRGITFKKAGEKIRKKDYLKEKELEEVEGRCPEDPLYKAIMMR